MKQSGLVVTEGLTKFYGRVVAVDSLAIDIRRGEVYGLLGPNGSGKTTTIRLLLGLLRPTAGWAKVGGFDCWRQSLDVRQLVSYLPGELRMYGSMSGLATLKLLCDLRRRRRAGPCRGDRREGDEVQSPASRQDLLDRHEAEAGPGSGFRRSGGHPHPG